MPPVFKPLLLDAAEFDVLLVEFEVLFVEFEPAPLTVMAMDPS
jgi:hypothetical protein